MTEQVSEQNVAAAPNLSPGARRMRAHRQRKRDGLQCVTLDLRETEINRLVALGFLRQEDRSN